MQHTYSTPNQQNTMHARNTRNKESPYENDVANELVDYLKKSNQQRQFHFGDILKKVVYMYIEANSFQHRVNTERDMERQTD